MSELEPKPESLNVMLPGWARHHPEVVEHVVEQAKRRAEGSDFAGLGLKTKAAVIGALVEAWFTGASDRRDVGPPDDAKAEAFAQGMADDALARIGAGIHLGHAAILMRRVATIVEERAAAERQRPPGVLLS